MTANSTKCKDCYDLYHLMYGKKYNPLTKGSEMQLKQAKELWGKIIDEGAEEYTQDGNLEILSDNKSIRLKNKKPGRPPITKNKEIKKTIRMDHETAMKLEDYCRTNNIKLSEAIRIAINKL